MMELKRMMEKLGQAKTHLELKKMIAEVDTNNSGVYICKSSPSKCVHSTHIANTYIGTLVIIPFTGKLNLVGNYIEAVNLCAY